MKFTLAEEAAEVDVGAAVVAVVAEHVRVAEVAVVAEHVRVADSLLRRLPLARHPARPHPARPLGQVLALVLDLQVVLHPVLGPQVARQAGRLRKVALLAGRLRKVALAQAAAPCQGKELPLHSVQPEQVQMSQAAVHRLAR